MATTTETRSGAITERTQEFVTDHFLLVVFLLGEAFLFGTAFALDALGPEGDDQLFDVVGALAASMGVVLGLLGVSAILLLWGLAARARRVE